MTPSVFTFLASLLWTIANKPKVLNPARFVTSWEEDVFWLRFKIVCIVQVFAVFKIQKIYSIFLTKKSIMPIGASFCSDYVLTTSRKLTPIHSFLLHRYIVQNVKFLSLTTCRIFHYCVVSPLIMFLTQSILFCFVFSVWRFTFRESFEHRRVCYSVRIPPFRLLPC